MGTILKPLSSDCRRAGMIGCLWNYAQCRLSVRQILAVDAAFRASTKWGWEGHVFEVLSTASELRVEGSLFRGEEIVLPHWWWLSLWSPGGGVFGREPNGTNWLCGLWTLLGEAGPRAMSGNWCHWPEWLQSSHQTCPADQCHSPCPLILSPKAREAVCDQSRAVCALPLGGPHARARLPRPLWHLPSAKHMLSPVDTYTSQKRAGPHSSP